MEIAEIIKEYFELENTDITNVINIYNDIYAYKVVHVNEVTASQVNYSVIRITEDGKVHSIPSKYHSAITYLLNSKDKYNDFKPIKKELEKKIEFLEDRIKKLQNKQKISSLIFDYLDLDELSREKFNEIIKKMSNLNKSGDLPY